MARFVIVFITFLANIDSSRILMLWLTQSGSHWIAVEPLFVELASRGHQVTVYSSFPQKKPLANYADVDLSNQRPPLTEMVQWTLVNKEIGHPLKHAFHVFEKTNSDCEMFNDSRMTPLLQSQRKYDVVVTEIFGNECLSYCAYKLKVPLISISTSVNYPWGSERTGLPDNPSYIPTYVVDFDQHMSFWQRAYNCFVSLYLKFWILLVFATKIRESTQIRLGEPLPPLGQVLANTSLVLFNSYHALSQARPFPPNVVEVGGMRIKERNPLPEDLQRILDTSEHGVIVMSFGSLLRSSSLPKPTLLMFMRAFVKIPQTILFKYEQDLPEAPPNVIVRKWLPQRDLVEDDRVLALVGHGGLGSTIEAVQFGKPLVGMPFFGDQPVNVAAVVRRGAGIALDIDALTQEGIERALDLVINDPSYRENMQELSHQFRDRPMSPLDTAVFWVEYVLRHRGAPHLRPASVDLAPTNTSCLTWPPW